jgi:1,4-dihydroxy-6-naphthoate synthase
MEKDVIKKHIDLYVNDYSLSLGEDGRRAVDKLFNMAKELI